MFPRHLSLSLSTDVETNGKKYKFLLFPRNGVGVAASARPPKIMYTT